MSFEIYTGVWTDWSRGRITGATITLSSRDASLLLAFIAAFVTVIAARLWGILCFSVHQFLAASGKHDGLYYQRQVILRNAPSAPAAAWLFVLQAWYWRGVARSALLRTAPWALLCACYFLAFASLAVFSAQISDAASNFRLLRSPSCGLHVPVDRDALQEKASYDNLRASIYSRECYHNKTSSLCGSLPSSYLPWTNESVGCPFAEDICLNTPAFKMETSMIDSHDGFGINEPPENRVKYKRETICSPLVTQPGFVEFVNGPEAEELGWDDGVLIRYLYGSNGRGATNYTMIYNTYGQNMQTAYATWTYYFLPNTSNPVWEPVEQLRFPNRDVSLILIAPNSVLHKEPNDDPIFAATGRREGTLLDGYLPVRYVSPIGCVDRHQICNPNINECTPMMDSNGVIRSAMEKGMALTFKQAAIVQRLRLVIATSTFYHVTFTRTQNFLRAQEKVSGLTQLPLPDNQWEIEMAALFDDALSDLQYRMLEYAAGSSAPGEIEVVKPWEGSTTNDMEVSEAYRAMCHNQRTKDTQGTLNFSILGLTLLLSFGSLIAFVSFVLEFVFAWLQKKTGWGIEKAKKWERDNFLQQMRMLYEVQGAGFWAGNTNDFPRTTSGDLFEHDEE